MLRRLANDAIRSDQNAIKLLFSLVDRCVEMWRPSPKKWGAKRVLVEDTGAGTSLVQELRSGVSGIIAVKRTAISKPHGRRVGKV